VNERIMRELGFGKEVENIKEGKCPVCDKQVKIEDFRNGISFREYNISGMCQFCQDDFFGVD